MSLLTSLRRAGELGPGMIRFRLEQRVRRKLAAWRHARSGPRRQGTRAAPDWAIQKFFLSAEAMADLPARARREFPVETRELLGVAHDALEGRVHLITGEVFDFKGPPRWHEDPISGSPPWPLAHFTALDALRLDDPCDIKVPWEVGRGIHLLRMAQAWVLTGDERFPAAIRSQLEDFFRGNPPGAGIQWVTPMEIALRALHWLWVDRLCAASAAFDPEFRGRLAWQLHAMGSHIHSFPEREAVSGNHFWCNGLGLMALGRFLPGCEDWWREGRGWVWKELFRQVRADGSSFECSTGYHRLVTELALLAWKLERLAGTKPPPGVRERLEQMVEFTAATLHPGGRSPHLGDHDGGRILSFLDVDPRDHRSLLGLARQALGGPAEGSGLAGWESLWWGSPAGVAPAAGTGPRPPLEIFEEAVVFVLRGTRLHSVWDAGPLAKPGNGVHGHADTLSGEISVDGLVLVEDCGTFGYTSDPARRNRYRGTASHNVVQLDGQEMAVPGEGQDLWRFLSDVPVGDVQHGQDASGVWWSACHEGYRVQGIPVTVSRRVHLNPAANRLEVVDRLEGLGSHEAVGRWHLCGEGWEPGSVLHEYCNPGFAPGIRVSVESREADLRLASSARSARWGEEHFGPCLEIRLRGELPLEWTTVFQCGATPAGKG